MKIKIVFLGTILLTLMMACHHEEKSDVRFYNNKWHEIYCNEDTLSVTGLVFVFVNERIFSDKTKTFTIEFALDTCAIDPEPYFVDKERFSIEENDMEKFNEFLDSCCTRRLSSSEVFVFEKTDIVKIRMDRNQLTSTLNGYKYSYWGVSPQALKLMMQRAEEIIQKCRESNDVPFNCDIQIPPQRDYPKRDSE